MKNFTLQTIFFLSNAPLQSFFFQKYLSADILLLLLLLLLLLFFVTALSSLVLKYLGLSYFSKKSIML